MKNKLSLAVLLSCLLFANLALARAIVPIDSLENLPVNSATGKSIKAQEIEQAIIAAAGINQWTVDKREPGLVTATLNVRNKHMISVKITYTTESYSVQYLSSDNMKYEVKDGVPSIHPFYNRWVKNLRDSIDRELLKR